MIPRLRSRTIVPRLLALALLLVALTHAAAAPGDKDGKKPDSSSPGPINIRLSEGVNRAPAPPAEGEAAAPPKRCVLYYYE